MQVSRSVRKSKDRPPQWAGQRLAGQATPSAALARAVSAWKKAGRLALEQVGGDEGVGGGLRAGQAGRGWADDRAGRELLAQERAALGEDVGRALFCLR